MGPEGVGKRRVAFLLASMASPHPIDLQVLPAHVLNSETVQSIREFHAFAPLDGTCKVSVIDLTHGGGTRLLGLLEQPAEHSRFILHSDVTPPLSVMSRCHVVRFGTLSTREVATVLERLGSPSQDAAEASGGSVSRALAWLNSAVVREDVERLFAALIDGEQARVRVLVQRLAEENPEAACAHLHRLLMLNRDLDPRFDQALRLLDTRARPSLRLRTAVKTLRG